MGALRNAAGVGAGEAALGPGIFAAVSAGRRMDLRGPGNLDDFGKRIQRLANMNNTTLTANTRVFSVGSSGVATVGTSGATFLDDALGKVRAGKIGVAGNLLASSMGGLGTQYLGGYFRGAQGFATAGGLSGAAEKGALRAVSHLDEAFAKIGIKTSAKTVLEGGVIKNLTSTQILKTLGTSGGAKVLGARAAALAVPGLQFVAAASFVYDLGKMGGEVIKSGINLARDANKSLQGSINKPMFGMGYKDTEAAATSRARGVMAIQNSRLNARSVLGSEAAVMASHFG